MYGVIRGYFWLLLVLLSELPEALPDEASGGPEEAPPRLLETAAFAALIVSLITLLSRLSAPLVPPDELLPDRMPNSVSGPDDVPDDPANRPEDVYSGLLSALLPEPSDTRYCKSLLLLLPDEASADETSDSSWPLRPASGDVLLFALLSEVPLLEVALPAVRLASRDDESGEMLLMAVSLVRPAPTDWKCLSDSCWRTGW